MRIECKIRLKGYWKLNTYKTIQKYFQNDVFMKIKELMQTNPLHRLALEESEAVYWSKYYGTDKELSCFVANIAGAFAGSVPQVSILAMNRVIGLGMKEQVKTKDIETIIQFYQQSGAKQFFVQLATHAVQQDLPAMLENAGFKLHNHWAKLVKKIDEPTTVNSGHMHLEQITDNPTKMKHYGHILLECFGWEDPRLKNWLCKTIGQIDYKHYLVYLEEKPIAAAALHIMDKYASLAFAGTLPEFRGQGTQQFLIAHRLNEALESGCAFAITETAAPTPQKSVQSYKNMVKMGFEEVYRRENWIYTL